MKESFEAIDFLVLPAEHGLLFLFGLEAHQVHLPHLLLEIPMLRLILHLERLSISLPNPKILPLDNWRLLCDFRVEGRMHSIGNVPIGPDLDGIILLLLVVESIVGDYSFDSVLGAGSLC